MAATWNEEHYSITEEPLILRFAKTPHSAEGIVTQAVINIDCLAPAEEAYLPTKPKAGWEEQTERRILSWMDQDLAEFFTRGSIRDGHLVYEIRHWGKANWKLSIGDLREKEQRQLHDHAEARQIGLIDVLEERRSRHPLIMRAKYRLRGRQ